MSASLTLRESLPVSAIAWLLDTRVLSEATRPTPGVGVMANLTRYHGELAVAVPVWHQLRFGWLPPARWAAR